MTEFKRTGAAIAAAALAAGPAGAAHADQLYTGERWASIVSDDKAHEIGDIVTVLVFEAASATNRVRNRSGRDTAVSGRLGAGSIDENASLRFGGSYSGSGEVERSDRLAATIAARVVALLHNGDLMLEGVQNIAVNGESRVVAVRGQVRRVDISADNTVPSSRLANAQIDYDGKGFVSRSARPGLLNRLFSFLGLG